LKKQERIDLLRQAAPIPYGNIVVVLSAALLAGLTLLSWYRPGLGLSAWFTTGVVTLLLCWHTDRESPATALHRTLGWWIRTIEATLLGRQLVMQDDTEHPLVIRRRFAPTYGPNILVWYVGGWIVRRGRVISEQERLKKWHLHRISVSPEHGTIAVQLDDSCGNRPSFTDYRMALRFLQEVRVTDRTCWQTQERVLADYDEVRQRVAEQRRALVRRNTPTATEIASESRGSSASQKLSSEDLRILENI